MTAHNIDIDAAASATVRRRRTDLLGVVPLGAGAGVVAVLLILTPWGARNEIGYAAVAPIRDAFWAGILLDGLAMVAVTLGLSLVVHGLVDRNGWVLATVGAVLAVAGGVAFALGGFGYATLAWHVTDASVVDPAAGAAVLESAIENPTHSLVVQIAGFLAMTLGMVLLALALVRSASVPRWLPAVVIATALLAFVVPPRLKDLAQAVQMAALVAIAVTSLRRRDREGLRAAGQR